MTQGQDVFNSVAKVGAANSYNAGQMSAAFQGVAEDITEVSGVLNDKITNISISGVGPVIVGSGSTPPDGSVDGQIAFFENASNQFFEYAWINNTWTRIKTQTNDVTPSGTSPFLLRGINYYNQSDINHVFATGIVDNENSIIGVESAIANNSAAISGNTAAISSNTAAISGIEGDVTANQTAIAANTTAISGIIIDVADNESAISGIIANGTKHDLTYRVETDNASSPQIQLVASDNTFTNVKLTGVSGITTSTISANELGIAFTGSAPLPQDATFRNLTVSGISDLQNTEVKGLNVSSTILAYGRVQLNGANVNGSDSPSLGVVNFNNACDDAFITKDGGTNNFVRIGTNGIPVATIGVLSGNRKTFTSAITNASSSFIGASTVWNKSVAQNYNVVSAASATYSDPDDGNLLTALIDATITYTGSTTSSSNLQTKQSTLNHIANALGGSVGGGNTTIENLPFEHVSEWLFNIYSTGSDSLYEKNKIYFTYIDTDTLKLNISQDSIAGASWQYPSSSHELAEFPISIIGKRNNGKKIVVLSGKTSSIRSLNYGGNNYFQVYVPAANVFKFDNNAVANQGKVECKIHGYM